MNTFTCAIDILELEAYLLVDLAYVCVRYDECNLTARAQNNQMIYNNSFIEFCNESKMIVGYINIAYQSHQSKTFEHRRLSYTLKKNLTIYT